MVAAPASDWCGSSSVFMVTSNLPFPSPSIFLPLSLSLSHSRSHTDTDTDTRTNTHTHTIHTLHACTHSLSPALTQNSYIADKSAAFERLLDSRRVGAQTIRSWTPDQAFVCVGARVGGVGGLGSAHSRTCITHTLPNILYTHTAVCLRMFQLHKTKRIKPQSHDIGSGVAARDTA